MGGDDVHGSADLVCSVWLSASLRGGRGDRDEEESPCLLRPRDEVMDSDLFRFGALSVRPDVFLDVQFQCNPDV